MGPILKPVGVPVDGILSIWCVDRIPQLGVISKLAEGALDPTVNVIGEDLKEYPSPVGHHSSPSRHSHCPPLYGLEPVFRSSNSPPIKSISFQSREKDVVGYRVKGLTELQIDDIRGASLVHWCTDTILKSH